VIVAGKQSQANKNYWVGVCDMKGKSRRGTGSQAGGRKSTARGTPQGAEATHSTIAISACADTVHAVSAFVGY